MLINDIDKIICDKYSKDGRCSECPLVVDVKDMLCRKNSHYNKNEKRWELD